MKGKFIKKLMAYALTAAMIVSTPMTAFATEFSDNFSVSDGVPGNGNDQNDTGTVSGTGTHTTPLEDSVWAKIKGVSIQPAGSISLAVEETTELTVSVDAPDATADEMATIIRRMRWKTDAYEDSYPITIDANIEDMSKCTVTAKHSGNAKVTVELYGPDEKVLTSDAVSVYVTDDEIEEPIYDIEWDPAIEEDVFYAGHTYDLNSYLLVNGQPYYSGNWESVLRITYATDADPKKQASITQYETPYDGNLEQMCGLTVARSLKTDSTIKVIAKFANEDADNIFASYANDGNEEFNDINSWEPVEATVKIAKGIPATKVIPSVKKAEVDFGDLYDTDGQVDLDLDAEAYYDDPTYGLCPAIPFSVILEYRETAIDDERAFDTVTFSPKNSSIARVVNNPEWDGTDETDAFLIVGRNVGKTTITVTASNGKKANISVKVNATLKYIESNGTIETWSGKTTPVDVTRVPAQNTDKLKITVEPAYKKFIKVKNQAIIPAANLKEYSEDGIDTTITVASSNKNSLADPCDVDVTVRQSDVVINEVRRYLDDDEDGASIANPETFKYLEYSIYDDMDVVDGWYNDNDGLGNDNPNVWRAGYTGFGTWSEDMTSEEAAESLSWTSSNPSVAVVNGGLVVAGGKPGTAKITVSSVGRSGNGYKTYKKSFKVKVTPVCNAITLKSYDVANVAGKNVKLSVKQLLPKKTIDNVEWFVDAIIDAEGNDVECDPTEVISTKKNLTYNIPADLEAGSMIVLRAESGVAATYARVYVLSNMTKKVEFRDENGDVSKTIRLGIGELKLLSVFGDSKGDAVKYGGYSVNKSGVVKVLELKDGRAIICGVGKGKATITAQMASGKKAKVTVIVE